MSIGGVGQGDFLDTWGESDCIRFYHLTLYNAVPRTATKCTISLLSFAMGVVNIMKTDKLFHHRAIRTSMVQNIKEILLTVTFSFIMLFVPIIHLAILILLSSIAIFSWSFTEMSTQPHHYLFLLPYLPILLVFLVQFILFQKYVKPSTAKQQGYAFLSIIIPVRIYMIKDKRQAFIYHVSSTINTCTSIFLSWLLLLIAVFHLDEDEDREKGFFIFMLELPVPLVLYFLLQMFIASLLQWYMVILPNFSTPHWAPDYEPLQDRIASFPSYSEYYFCNLVLQKKESLQPTYSEEILEISQREWKFLEHVVEAHIDETHSAKDEFIKRKKTLEDILQLEDLSADMEFSFIDHVDEEAQVKEQLLMNLGHTRAMISTRDNFSPFHFAKAGFFYSHPRLNGLQVRNPY